MGKEVIGRITYAELVKRRMDAYMLQCRGGKMVCLDGGLTAYNEILRDLDILSESEFTIKYMKITDDIGSFLDDYLDNNRSNRSENELKFYIDYNNIIVSVLGLLDKRYTYANFMCSDFPAAVAT